MIDEEAKAVQEVAKFGTKALDSGGQLGTFLSKVFGTVPSDVVGVLGGDWLHHVRIRNAVKLAQRTEEILRERGIYETSKPMSPSIAIPILTAGQDETRDELRELWARLLANGMDPERRNLIRQSIINTVKQFDPLDALVLFKLSELWSAGKAGSIDDLREFLGVTEDELTLSLFNIDRLGCADAMMVSAQGEKLYEIRRDSILITALGRQVLRATAL